MTVGLSEAPGIGKLLMENRFSVPNHQRDYSWTVDEVRELIDDITNAIDNGHDVYFIGLMVFLGTDQSHLVVLDGQQRLATAVIIFSAIRSWLKQYDEFQQDSDDIQRDYIGRRALGQTQLQARFSMNAANDQMFNDFIIRSSTITDIETALVKLKRRDRNRRMLEAALYAHKRIREMADKIGSRSEAAKYFYSFVEYMRDNVGVVKLIVPSDEIAYTIFETLNDRGLELSPLDLVKNHLFARAAEHSSSRRKSAAPANSRIKIMEERWAQMMQMLSNVRSDNFLKAFWTSRHGRIRTRNLFDVFKTQYANAEQANELSVDMLKASEQYAALEMADDPVWARYSSDTRTLIRSLKVVGSQQTHPVMLAALAKMDVREVERLLRLLEVCTVRYLLIVGGNTGRFETTCAILARKIYAREITTATSAYAELKDIYPSDDEFKRAFAIKEEENNSKAQYYLRKLEIEAQRVARGGMPGELEPGTLTIEHVLPKNPGTEWADVLKEDPGLAEDCIFRLGNLCLLTDVNRKLGRQSFSEKKKTYARSWLETTKELAGYNSWGRHEIETRQENMAKLAAATWRFQ